MNISLEEMQLNIDSSHSIEHEMEMQIEKQFPILTSLGAYFEVVEYDPDHPTAKCLLCTKKKKKNVFYKGFKNSLSNWESHLSCAHPEENIKYREAKAKETAKRVKHRNRYNLSPSKSHVKAENFRLKSTDHCRSRCDNKKKYSKLYPRQQQITQFLLKTIACDSLPLSIVDKPSFKRFIEELNVNYTIPNRKTIKEVLLPSTEKLIVNSIKAEMKDLTSVYMTVDIWNNQKICSFIGLTVNFIDNDFNLKSRLLCCEHFAEKHTTANITKRYEEVVMRYQIDGKVRRIVSHNASSMKKAFDLILVDRQVDMENCHDDIYCDCKDDFQDPEEDLDTLLALLPKRVSCFAHSLRLCIMHAEECIKERLYFESGDFQTKELTIHSIIAKAEIIASILKSTTKPSAFSQKNDIYKSTEKQLWNSSLRMLQSFVNSGKDVINAAVDELSKSENDKIFFKLTTIEFSVIKELVDMLSPFEDAIFQVEVESNVAANKVCAVVTGLKKSLEDMMLKTRYCRVLCRVLLDEVNQRLNPYLVQEDFQLAAFLDPRFKADWLETEQERDSLKKVSVQLVEKLVTKKASDTVTSRKRPLESDESEHDRHSSCQKTENHSSSENQEKLRRGLFSFMPLKTSAAKNGSDPSRERIIEDEVLRYLATERESMDCDVLGYWKNERRFPHLRIAAKELLGMTAASNQFERVFNHADELYKTKSAKVSVKTFAILMLMRMNTDLI